MVTKKIQGEQTKERLLAAAFEVLKTKGVKSLTASQIVQVAGVSKGGFFHHFPTIEDFYVYMLDQIIGMFESQLFEKKYAHLTDFLEHSTSTTLRMIDESPEIMSAIYYFIDFSLFNPVYAQRLQRLIKAGLDKWTADLSGYFPSNFPQEKRSNLVYILDMYFSGLGTHYMILKDRKQYLNITKEFISMVINYVEGGTK